MRKKPIAVIFISLLGLCLIAAVLIYQALTYWDKPFIPNQPVYYELQPGTSLTQLANDLHQMRLLKHPRYFVLLARLQDKSRRLQAGEYLFPANTSRGQVLAQMVAGKVIQRAFTIVDGWTFIQMKTNLDNNPYLTHTLKNISPENILTQMNLPAGSPEGMFYPDTYLFAKGTADSVILTQAYQRMQAYLNQQWQVRAENLPYENAYTALIAASLIQKETAVKDELPLVAGVIVLRLQNNIPLQIDPTVIYGMQENYQGNITRKDLQTDTLYNTYTRRGLPPTPIAIPSPEAIYAALHPLLEGYLYFVAKGDGSHSFSKTLQEQNKAVQQYQLMKSGTKPNEPK